MYHRRVNSAAGSQLIGKPLGRIAVLEVLRSIGNRTETRTVSIPMSPRLKQLALLGVLTLLVGCDHATKFAAKSDLQGEQPHELIGGFLDLRYVENTDVAFNLLRWIPESTRAPILVIIGGVAVLCLGLVVLSRSRFSRTKLALLLVTAGAVGNYLDRILRGYVVDFVHVEHWPVFNVADIYVTLGVALLAISMLTDRRVRSHA